MSYSLTRPADAIRLLVDYFLDERMEAEGAGHMLATPYSELTCGHAQGMAGDSAVYLLGTSNRDTNWLTKEIQAAFFYLGLEPKHSSCFSIEGSLGCGHKPPPSPALSSPLDHRAAE